MTETRPQADVQQGVAHETGQVFEDLPGFGTGETV